MILGARRFVGLMLSCVSVLCSNAGAAAAIDPELLRQAMQMPPAQREASNSPAWDPTWGV